MRVAPWLAAFLVVFVAEWGDLTQLASAALVGMTGEPLTVAIGAIAALWSVTLLVTIAGARLRNVLTPVVLNRASSLLLAGVGLFVLVSAVRL